MFNFSALYKSSQGLSIFARHSHTPGRIYGIWKKAYLVNMPTVSGKGLIWELTTMAKVCKKFDDVAEIVPNQGSTRIKVRVLRLWKIPSFLNPFEISSIEMVLVDEKGAKIHASIRKQFYF
ncbi:replication protein A 70 kDa DNA-binding subunit [Trifolium repens]|nr:replication protein A 70 kDa DNA-binding subunit [Trifolium repens]KAK2387551.1 replication protein A 70 kDa DNA-binding subunit [Trifolium repens]